MKKGTKDVMMLAGLGIGTAIGAKVISGIDAPGMAGAQGAMTGFASMLPVAGSVAGAGLVMRQLGQFGNMAKKKK